MISFVIRRYAKSLEVPMDVDPLAPRIVRRANGTGCRLDKLMGMKPDQAYELCTIHISHLSLSLHSPCPCSPLPTPLGVDTITAIEQIVSCSQRAFSSGQSGRYQSHSKASSTVPANDAVGTQLVR